MLKAFVTTLALTVAMVAAARADEVAPPAKMEGGIAVELVDPTKANPPSPGVERIKIGTSTGIVITGDDKKSARRVAEIRQPKTEGHRYLVKGWIRYEDVEGDGFAELWNHFGDGAFFSRTLGDSGPMAKISGSSDWRVFILPFNPEEGKTPERLELNIVLPGKGKVTVTDVRLVHFAPETQSAVTPAATPATPRAPADDASRLAGGTTATLSKLGTVAGPGLLALIIALLVGVSLYIIQRSRVRRAMLAGELRRMQAMDSIS